METKSECPKFSHLIAGLQAQSLGTRSNLSYELSAPAHLDFDCHRGPEEGPRGRFGCVKIGRRQPRGGAFVRSRDAFS